MLCCKIYSQYNPEFFWIIFFIINKNNKYDLALVIYLSYCMGWWVSYKSKKYIYASIRQHQPLHSDLSYPRTHQVDLSVVPAPWCYIRVLQTCGQPASCRNEQRMRWRRRILVWSVQWQPRLPDETWRCKTSPSTECRFQLKSRNYQKHSARRYKTYSEIRGYQEQCWTPRPSLLLWTFWGAGTHEQCGGSGHGGWRWPPCEEEYMWRSWEPTCELQSAAQCRLQMKPIDPATITRYSFACIISWRYVIS